MIKVLIVDDSAVAREFLSHLVSTQPDMQVAGVAADGMEAVELAERLRPDLITMDIQMPRMGGAEAIRHIMQAHPAPIVVVTGNEITEEVRATFESLESGALAIVPRPVGGGGPLQKESCDQLVQTIRLMSEIKVVRRWSRVRPSAPRPAEPGRLKAISATTLSGRDVRVVAIGASTGGPAVLKTLLEALPADFPAPVVIVQHISPGFVAGFASWLNDSIPLPVVVASHGMALRPGCVFIAPEGFQFGIAPDETVKLTKEAVPSLLCPSVTHLFNSVAHVFGAAAIGILLTGMGRDGADGMISLKKRGALTIAQDQASSVIHGMPGEAIKLGAADRVLSPEKIIELLNAFAFARSPSA